MTLAATRGRWNSLVLRPAQDLAALFPDLDSRDFSLFTLRQSAVSRGGATAGGCFDYLRFFRGTTGEVALQVQDDIMTTSARRYPSVTQQHGLELSHFLPHVNWFGGVIALPDYTGIGREEQPDFLRHTVLPRDPPRGWLGQLQPPVRGRGRHPVTRDHSESAAGRGRCRPTSQQGHGYRHP